MLTATVSRAPEAAAHLEVRRQGRWSSVATQVTDVKGHGCVHRREQVDGRPATYRVRAVAYGGLPRSAPAPVSAASAWGDPALVDGFDGEALGPAWEHRIQFHNPWGRPRMLEGRPLSRGRERGQGTAQRAA